MSYRLGIQNKQQWIVKWMNEREEYSSEFFYGWNGGILKETINLVV
jgi:hypothetical protein